MGQCTGKYKVTTQLHSKDIDAVQTAKTDNTALCGKYSMAEVIPYVQLLQLLCILIEMFLLKYYLDKHVVETMKIGLISESICICICGITFYITYDVTCHH